MDHSSPVTSASPHNAPFYPGLTGLRGLAVLAVFLCHYADVPWPGVWNHSPFWYGWAGVDLFFVLSGFLITGILFDSLGSSHFFHHFYVRRTLRIFPLFYAVWAVCLLATPFVPVEWNRYVVAQMFYMGNFTLPGAFAGSHPNPGILMVGNYPLNFTHFWTLCIEEQFYLLWPLVVYTVRRRESLLRVAIAASVVILLLRCTLVIFFRHGFTTALYSASYSRFDSLLIGSAVALWLRGRPIGFLPSRRLCATLFFGPALVLAALLATVGRSRPLETTNPVFNTVGYTLLALSAAGAILACLDTRTHLGRWMLHPWLASLGTVSYSFYVLHAIPLHILIRENLLGDGAGKLSLVLLPVIGFPIFYKLAYCSYRWLESPFLKLKNKLAPTGPRFTVDPKHGQS